ncbi:hypothetical protein HanXRQr2_Chr03g0110111 [Helianthus annuus]|uniref:Uncharacterized protein n=1 Tax=Helianthus annuus TaxID=4232 RepID=A0A9K3JG65_HELAN|nr:hypothetical protein HanXRQr2_Chr03g0110111 [Helianthus annuus]
MQKAGEKPVDKEKELEKKKVVAKEKEMEKKRAADKPLTEPKETEVAATTLPEKAQGPEVVHITGLDQPIHERGKGPEVEKPTKPASADAPVQTMQVTSPTVGSDSAAHKEKTAAAGGASSGGAGRFTYTKESRGTAPHQAPWSLKQRDTFKEFVACPDWFLNSFTLDEVIRQRARTHDGLYQAYVVSEANTRAANHQIVHEWRTMVKERSDWEKYSDRLLREAKDFEKYKVAFVEEKAKFEADRKSEEWGREGLRGKLRTAEELLAKERAEWKKICAKDNERMYAARSKITELECNVAELTGKVEDMQAAKENVEVREALNWLR